MTHRTIASGDRVLVVRPGALGDTLLALPAIRAIRGAVGSGSRVDVLGYPRILELAVNPLHASAALSIDRSVFASLFRDGPRPELKALLETYSFIVAWCRGALLEDLGVPYIQCPAYPEPPSREHATDHLFASLRRLGIEASPLNPELVIPESAHTRAHVFLARSRLEERGFIALHPGSGSAKKNWPPENFARLACLAHEEKLAVLLVEGEADEQAVTDVKARLSFSVHGAGRLSFRATGPHPRRDVAQGCSRARWAQGCPATIARGLDLLDRAAVLSRARAYFGSDSGVSHLAAATGVPTVVWFGPTDPSVWAPRGDSVRIVTGFTKPEAMWGDSKGLMREPHGL